MRGTDIQNDALFAYVTPESFVPKDHPLRAIRSMAVLKRSPGSLISMHRLQPGTHEKPGPWCHLRWQTGLGEPKTGTNKAAKEQNNQKQQHLNSKTNSKNQPAGLNGLKSRQFSTAC